METVATLTITEPTPHTVRYETACNYDKYTLLPGEYPVKRLDGRHALSVEIKATHDARYMESRLFTASSVDTDTEPGETSVYLHSYILFGSTVEKALNNLRGYGTIA